MSSILKALRKLEDDKSALGEGQVDIAHDILKRGYEVGRGSKNRLLIGFFGLSVLIIVAAVFWPNHSVAPLQTNVDKAKTPVVVEAVQPPLPAESPEPVTGKAALSPILSRPKTGPVVPPDALDTADQAVKPVASSPAPNHPQPLTIPDLLVTEIVDNPVPEARLAIVNDLPVMEGTDIDGAKVLEILPDRVRFSYRGIEIFKVIRKE